MDDVVCDICSKDWTNSNVSGGLIFAGNGVCPDCAKRITEQAIQCGEIDAIEDECPAGISFADWIRAKRLESGEVFLIFEFDD